MKYITIIFLLVILAGCSNVGDLNPTPFPTPTIGVWLGNVVTPVPLAEWMRQQATAGIPVVTVDAPAPQATTEQAIITVVIQATPRAAVSPPTSNPTGEALRYRSTELALSNLAADATRQAHSTREAEVITALQTRAAVTREAIRATAQAPTQLLADIAAPLVSVVCVLMLGLAGLVISGALYGFAKAKADIERALANREFYNSRVIETPKGSFWIDDDGQPTPLQHSAPPTRFVAINNSAPAAPKTPTSQDTQDVIEFLDLCIQHGGKQNIPSRTTLGMAAGTWQRLKHLLTSARDASGVPINWVASGPNGTTLVGGWECDTARDAIAGGEVVV